MAEISESDAIDLALLAQLPERIGEIRPRLSVAAQAIADKMVPRCGYISSPDPQQLRPTPKEASELGRLWKWVEDSKNAIL